MQDMYHRATALGIPASIVENIAYVCHEANRAYCRTLGDHTQVEWSMAPAWQKDSARKGVIFCLENPDAGPDASHVNWMDEKLADGWEWAPMKDPEHKKHPALVPYRDLPFAHQVKDAIFGNLVRAMDPRSNSRWPLA